MKYKIHKVEVEQKLSKVADKYSISIKKIKEANPKAKFFKTIFGDEFVAALQGLKIPVKEDKVVTTVKSEEKLNFEKAVRFRCKQVNVTKALDNVTFSSNLKTEYLLSTARDSKR